VPQSAPSRPHPQHIHPPPAEVEFPFAFIADPDRPESLRLADRTGLTGADDRLCARAAHKPRPHSSFLPLISALLLPPPAPRSCLQRARGVCAQQAPPGPYNARAAVSWQAARKGDCVCRTGHPTGASERLQKGKEQACGLNRVHISRQAPEGGGSP